MKGITMPPSHIDMILAELRTMREEQRADTAALHRKIDSMTANGCARLPEQLRIADDHEKRIRANEVYRYKQTGQISLIGAGGGIVGAAMIALGRFLLKEVF